MPIASLRIIEESLNKDLEILNEDRKQFIKEKMENIPMPPKMFSSIKISSMSLNCGLNKFKELKRTLEVSFQSKSYDRDICQFLLFESGESNYKFNWYGSTATSKNIEQNKNYLNDVVKLMDWFTSNENIVNPTTMKNYLIAILTKMIEFEERIIRCTRSIYDVEQEIQKFRAKEKMDLILKDSIKIYFPEQYPYQLNRRNAPKITEMEIVKINKKTVVVQVNNGEKFNLSNAIFNNIIENYVDIETSDRVYNWELKKHITRKFLKAGLTKDSVIMKHVNNK